MKFSQPIEFQWDNGNTGKNLKHDVTDAEAEQVFFDERKFIFKDQVHSIAEKRYKIIGRTKEKRLLYIAFTLRREKIRIISARDINKKEAYLYEKAT